MTALSLKNFFQFSGAFQLKCYLFMIYHPTGLNHSHHLCFFASFLKAATGQLLKTVKPSQGHNVADYVFNMKASVGLNYR